VHRLVLEQVTGRAVGARGDANHVQQSPVHQPAPSDEVHTARRRCLMCAQRPEAVKLSDRNVTMVRNLAGMFPQAVIAKAFDLAQHTVSRIVAGARRQHLEATLDAGRRFAVRLTKRRPLPGIPFPETPHD
jgi:hypothetical protein